MSNGQGCTCNAWSENECACGADWTPQEVYALRAENNRLKDELKSIDGALDDPRANLTLTTAEIIWEMKAELAEAKKDAELWREREARIKLLKERGFLRSPLRGEPYKIDMKGK